MHFDGDLPGFGLRVRASGVHTWMIQYAIAGRTRRVVLGLQSALDPGKARATAQKLLAQVRLGKDPAADKARARVAAAETFGALLPRFLRRQETRLRPRSYVETVRHLEVNAKPLHGLPLEAVTRRAIVQSPPDDPQLFVGEYPLARLLLRLVGEGDRIGVEVALARQPPPGQLQP